VNDLSTTAKDVHDAEEPMTAAKQARPGTTAKQTRPGSAVRMMPCVHSRDESRTPADRRDPSRAALPEGLAQGRAALLGPGLQAHLPRKEPSQHARRTRF
jgi:hypothetical protein